MYMPRPSLLSLLSLAIVASCEQHDKEDRTLKKALFTQVLSKNTNNYYSLLERVPHLNDTSDITPQCAFDLYLYSRDLPTSSWAQMSKYRTIHPSMPTRSWAQMSKYRASIKAIVIIRNIPSAVLLI